jgi:hypothetical protein
MKRIIEDGGGSFLESLLGENVQLWGLNYIYAGKLVAVSDTEVLLEDPYVVYETGELTDEKFHDAQKVATKELGINRGIIESYGRAPQLD